MDPNATLARLRELAHEVDNGAPDGHRFAAEDFAEAFKALDEWLTRGGFLPTRCTITVPAGRRAPATTPCAYGCETEGL